MKKIFLLAISILVMHMHSTSWGEEAVDAIALSVYKQDYTITRVIGLYVYGTIDNIEISVDEVTGEKSVKSIILQDGSFFQRFWVVNIFGSVQQGEYIQRKLALLKQGQEIAVSVKIDTTCNIYSSACHLGDVYFDFNKITRNLPTEKRPFAVTVDEYFSQQLMYGRLPVKIKGIVAEIEGTRIVYIVGEKYGQKIWCVTDDTTINKLIYNKVNIGDVVTCVGTFEEEYWDTLRGSFLIELHDLIVDN